MATTIIGPATATFPLTQSAAIIETRAQWGDAWTTEPDLELIGARAAAAGHDLGQATILHKYGDLRRPHDGGSGHAVRTPRDLDQYWVRIRFAGGDGGTQIATAWHGQVTTESRDVVGTSPANAGRQLFVALEPGHQLNRIQVSRSTWLRDSALRDIGWMPPFNRRDERGLFVGNRSDAKDGDSYVFGEESEWTRRQAIEYLLVRHVDDEAAGGPPWVLGGDLTALDAIADIVPVRAGETVAQMIDRLVPREIGLDWVVRFDEAGDKLEVFVYALQAEEHSFAGQTLPRNPRTVRVEAGRAVDNVATRVVQTKDNLHRTIRIVGNQVVVCASLLAPTDVSPAWTSTQETAYNDGDPEAGAGPLDHDQYRQGDRFRPVYQQFRVSSTWLMQGGQAAPAVDAFGDVAINSTDWQQQVRSTLDWLPLREGFDYTTDPATDNNPTGHVADQLAPAAWILDPVTFHYLPVETEGMGVAVAKNALGVMVSASPNHLLARNHFSGAASTETDPRFDHETLEFLIAFQSDERLSVQHVVDTPPDNTSVMEIRDDQAECWILAPNTTLGVDEATGLLERSGGNMRVLRNDKARLHLRMAAAIARYGRPRRRAEIVVQGWRVWSELIGQVVEVIDAAGSTQQIDAPITSIEWRGGERPKTVILAGFAR